MISFKNVYKSYTTQKDVLTNFNLEIECGEFMVFIGPSGSGKTTALKMINRLEDPTSGEIFLKNKNLLEYNLQKMRFDIGYVLQQVALFPHLSVRKNIGIVAELQKWDTTKINKRVCELLEIIGLDHKIYADKMPSELSGGEASRVGIARALMVNPSVILMDEPFGALDPLTKTELQQEVKRLQKDMQKTIVFVTHDMEEALFLGDRISIIQDGKIIQCATPKDIIENPNNEFIDNFLQSGLRNSR